MSLDVYVILEKIESYDGGKTFKDVKETVYNSNITHNLSLMASKAGIYDALWRPHRLLDAYIVIDSSEEYDFEKTHKVRAKEITPFIENGLMDMIRRPKFYKAFNPENSWGSYKVFIPWIIEYLDALKEYPEALIETWR